jgi:hypothetical protein
MHGPALVAEVALELSEDRGDGERRKRDPARGIEPIDSFDQAETRHLRQVIERLLRSGVAACDLPSEREVAAHQLLARAPVALALPSPEQLGHVEVGWEMRTRLLCP